MFMSSTGSTMIGRQIFVVQMANIGSSQGYKGEQDNGKGFLQKCLMLNELLLFWYNFYCTNHFG